MRDAANTVNTVHIAKDRKYHMIALISYLFIKIVESEPQAQLFRKQMNHLDLGNIALNQKRLLQDDIFIIFKQFQLLLNAQSS